MAEFVRAEVWPLETVLEELGWDGMLEAMRPLRDEVKRRGLWAAR
jgi:hypothetical protein